MRVLPVADKSRLISRLQLLHQRCQPLIKLGKYRPLALVIRMFIGIGLMALLQR